MSETSISGNFKHARIENGSFIADISPDEMIINLRNYTMPIRPEELWDMELAVELTKQMWIEAGILDKEGNYNEI